MNFLGPWLRCEEELKEEEQAQRGEQRKESAFLGTSPNHIAPAYLGKSSD